MTKFSGVATNTAPSLADFLLGVSSGNVDQRSTIQQLINVLNLNNKFNAGAIDWSTAGQIWWQELGRVTAGSNSTTLSLSSLAARKHLMILAYIVSNGGTSKRVQFNGDAGANYANRYSANGAADTTEASTTAGVIAGNTTTSPTLSIFTILNVATAEKTYLGQIVQQNAAGAANVPDKFDFTGKWANTAAQITRADMVGSASGLGIGSELIVLGRD